jgi:hypothetical protein
MERGLDELIEWLLAKIGFSGLEGKSLSTSQAQQDTAPHQPCHILTGALGFSALDLVKAVKTWHASSSTGEDPVPFEDEKVDASDVVHASKVWEWLIARNDVMVVPANLARKPLEEVLSLSGQLPRASAAASGSSSNPEDATPGAKGRSSSTAKEPTRLFLSQERQWKAIAGHGPDFKRIPRFEWDALVAIASVKEKGILQGDLTRLTGQDKRSLPTRTDALARKGYIIKQQTMVRGCKTSKLWLVQFAKSAKADVVRQGLPPELMAIPEQEIIKDWNPVSFSQYYTSDPLDYIAISQAFLLVLKAFKAMRYSDLRTKMDVRGVPQMRALAKSSRWWARAGVVLFEPMQSQSGKKLFKDCVKYIREPTVEEWAKYRATPKANLKVPSSRYRNKKKPGAKQPETAVELPTSSRRNGKKPLLGNAPPQQELPSPALIRLSAWTPYKPIINNIFEIIKRGGLEGSTNKEIGMFNLGWSYRKWTSTFTTLMGLPRSLPDHLQDFAVAAQLQRVGKTNTYKFVAQALTAEAAPEEDAGDGQSGKSTNPGNANALVKYQFPEPKSKAFLKPGNRVTGFIPKSRGNKPHHIPLKRKREPSDEPAADVGKRAKVQSPKPRDPTPEVEPPPPPPPPPPVIRPPGVYMGKRNSLDPIKKTLGRPRKSIVLEFVSPALRDPEFFIRGKTNEASRLDINDTGEPEAAEDTSTPSEDVSSLAPIDRAENREPDASSQEPVQTPARRGRWPAGGTKPFKCDKCGNSWKNSNGLEYHQRKSQSACNPDWVAPPPKPLPAPVAVSTPRPKRGVQSIARAEATGELSMNGASSPPQTPEIPKKSLPSRRPKLAVSSKAPALQQAERRSKVMTTHSVVLHNVPELPSMTKNHTAQENENTLPRQLPEKPPKVSSQATNKRTSREDADKFILATSGKQSEGHSRTLRAKPQSSGATVESNDNTNEDGHSFVRNPSGTKGSREIRSLEKTSNEIPPAEAETQQELERLDYSRNSRKSLDLSILFSRASSGRQPESTERRELTKKIIMELLEKNGQVLPGDMALYILISESWKSNQINISAPDWRVYQSILKKMEEAQMVKKDYFGFFDQNGAHKTTCVVWKPTEGTSDRDTAKIIEQVKNKSRELHPLPYIPAIFPVPQQTIESYCNTVVTATRRTATPKKRASTMATLAGQQVPVLGYQKPVERAAKSKNPSSPTTAECGPGPKRSWQGGDGSDNQENPTRRKRGKRRSDSEHAMGEDKSVPVPRDQIRSDRGWNQKQSYLPDSRTGAWSVLPWTNGKPPAADRLLASKQTRAASSDGTAHRLRSQNTERVSKGWVRAEDDQTWAANISPPGMRKALEASSTLYFLQPATPATLAKANDLDEDSSSGEEDNDDSLQTEMPKESDEHVESADGYTFTPIHPIQSIGHGVWPAKFPKAFFMDRPCGSFTAVGYFPDPRWFLKENLPQDLREMVDSTHLRLILSREDTSLYGQFGRDIAGIEAWELSPEGIYLQNRGSIAPDYIFISLGLDPGHAAASRVEMDPAEWNSRFQYTAESMPEEFRNASPEDEILVSKEMSVTEMPRRGRRRRDENGNEVRRFVKRSEGNWKQRSLYPIPKRPIGRWNKQRAVGDNIGRAQETELVVAVVIIRKLLGGVDKVTDWGLVLKLYPAWSFSGIKKFWARLSKERASFIQALSRKFETSFLKAYEKGEVPPINYDDLENYDWKSVIAWAVKLQTHDGIELPPTRSQFDKEYTLTDPMSNEENWREPWFGFQSSTFARLEGSTSQQVTLPATKPSAARAPERASDLQLARSWIRALCNNTNQKTVGHDIKQALLRLGNRDATALNELLERSVSQLMDGKVISRVFGKGLNQVFKLNNVFEQRVKKFSNIDKFTQSVAFKAELDRRFRNNESVTLPYNADDGSMMAALNLQAYGRIRLEHADLPYVPFGFEPGNYETRKYPKKYYQFDVKLVATESYVYDEDLPLVAQAKDFAVPKEGPHGEIPIWYDFFGNLDLNRWIQFLCLTTFALAVKGPLKAESTPAILMPTIEVFEARLVMEWLDSLGLLERVAGNRGCTVSEWSWLVVGHLACMFKSDKDSEDAEAAQ